MLEELDAIDWSTHTDAYGKATAVPALIRKLVSSSSEIWEMALDDLRGRILHQGHLYESTVFVVPFFIELLEYDVVQCKNELLSDLIYISFAAYGHDTLYNAVSQGLSTYLKLLDDRNPKTRIRALYTIHSLGEQTREVNWLLYTHFLQETDPQARANFVIYFSSRMHLLPEIMHLLHDLLYAEEEPLLVKAVAALMHVERNKELTSREVVQLLLDVAVTPDILEVHHPFFPWFDGSIIGKIVRTLCLVKHEHADLIIQALLGRFKQLEQHYQICELASTFDVSGRDRFDKFFENYRLFEDAGDIIPTLFHFAFPTRPLPANAVPFLLTTTQRVVFGTIVKSGLAGDHSGEMVHYLDELGLPPRWKLKLLLE